MVGLITFPESCQAFLCFLVPFWLGSISHQFVRPIFPAASGVSKKPHLALCHQLTGRVLSSKYLQNLPTNLEPCNLVPLKSLLSLSGLPSNCWGLGSTPQKNRDGALISGWEPQKHILTDLNPAWWTVPPLTVRESSWEGSRTDCPSLFSPLIGPVEVQNSIWRITSPQTG